MYQASDSSMITVASAVEIGPGGDAYILGVCSPKYASRRCCKIKQNNNHTTQHVLDCAVPHKTLESHGDQAASSRGRHICRKPSVDVAVPAYNLKCVADVAAAYRAPDISSPLFTSASTLLGTNHLE